MAAHSCSNLDTQLLQSARLILMAIDRMDVFRNSQADPMRRAQCQQIQANLHRAAVHAEDMASSRQSARRRPLPVGLAESDWKLRREALCPPSLPAAADASLKRFVTCIEEIHALIDERLYKDFASSSGRIASLAMAQAHIRSAFECVADAVHGPKA